MIVSGIGIHSGSTCEVRLHRTEGRVRFLRNGVAIAAEIAAVVAADRCTVLASGGERVAMVEHLLAALHVAGWWRGIAIEASSAELPVLDGSAEPWLEPIAQLGPPPPAPAPLVLERPVRVTHGASEIEAEPGTQEICCEIHFGHPAIGHQTWCGNSSTYPELMPARTFGFEAEADALRRAGLARGASLDNVVVFGAAGPIRPLRTPDEPVRHKALDLLGDLFLLQRPLAARIRAERGSHELHLAFVRAVVEAAHPHAESVR